MLILGMYMGFVKDRVTKMPRFILRAVAPSFETMLLHFPMRSGLRHFLHTLYGTWLLGAKLVLSHFAGTRVTLKLWLDAVAI